MIPVVDIASTALFVASGFYFLAGSVGLVRFPDVYTRLHALTKADNLGLGLLVTGLALRSGSWYTVAKLYAIWLLVLFASATSCYLVAHAARTGGIPVWRNERP